MNSKAVCKALRLVAAGAVIVLAAAQWGREAEPTMHDGLGLRRGVNLGNALEAPYEGAWGVVLHERYFQLIKEAGFDTVRVPVKWSAHAALEPPYTINEDFLRRVGWVVDRAIAHGLNVILNVHHYDEFVAEPEAHWVRFLALWDQIAHRFAAFPDTVLFELLNEPHGRVTSSLWNELLQQALATIRPANPRRWVVIGPVEWNHPQALSTLQLPAHDRRLVVTFHYYEPFRFTHQGAEWVAGSSAWRGTRWTGGLAERREVTVALESAARWAREQGRPLLLGEFGAYGRADLASRVEWTQWVAREAERLDIPWVYWEFCAGFGVYDAGSDSWLDPLLQALLPADRR